MTGSSATDKFEYHLLLDGELVKTGWAETEVECLYFICYELLERALGDDDDLILAVEALMCESTARGLEGFIRLIRPKLPGKCTYQVIELAGCVEECGL